MNTTTANIAFQGSLLSEIDRVALTESRSRSELLREAARLYIDRKRRRGKLFAYGKNLAASRPLTENDIAMEIQSHRQNRSEKR